MQIALAWKNLTETNGKSPQQCRALDGKGTPHPLPPSSVSFALPHPPPQVLASRDRKVIDGLKGYQSAIEQNHSTTAAQVLPATGRERSGFGKP